ncbi:MAG TPA: ribosome silencing factor [Bacteroidales bacterium]|nr:ribosome silencing factor [Bacteroidales bacterium]
MIRQKIQITSEKLADAIIEGIKDKKGLEITQLGFKKIKNAICDSFIICHGNSSTHVEAIADGLVEYVRIKHGVKPWRSEGYQNAEWVLIDYVDVVVHVFQQQTRNYYRLEDLWSDAEFKQFETVE